MTRLHFHVANGLAGGYMPNDVWATEEADTAFEDMIEYAEHHLDGQYMLLDENDLDDDIGKEILSVQEQLKELKELWANEDTHDDIIREGASIVLDNGNYYVEMTPCPLGDCVIDDDDD